MKNLPKVGTLGEERFVVEPRHAIDFAVGGMPAVLSTSWLIWFLEHAARAAILPLLEARESTVGMEVQVRHLAATPVGQTVTCRARVLTADRSEVSFQLEALDERTNRPWRAPPAGDSGGPLCPTSKSKDKSGMIGWAMCPADFQSLAL
jgi:fluoroacetyl-CoA thioesterase